MNKIFTDVLKDAIRLRIQSEIIQLGKDFAIPNIEVEFDDMKHFFIIAPYLKDKQVSSNFRPEFITELTKNGFDVQMIYAEKNKGLRMYTVLRKQI